jgi:hypothetical protein
MSHTALEASLHAQLSRSTALTCESGIATARLKFALGRFRTTIRWGRIRELGVNTMTMATGTKGVAA